MSIVEQISKIDACISRLIAKDVKVAQSATYFIRALALHLVNLTYVLDL